MVAATFWSNLVKQQNSGLNAFMNSPRTMALAVAQIISPADSADTKLRKLFARTQQLQNLTFMPDGPERTDKIAHAGRWREVEEVWTAGYGTQAQITALLLALTRAAGFQADDEIAPTRDDQFFDERWMYPARLHIPLVLVHLDGQDLYLDPGEPLMGFGEIGWAGTGVKALRYDDKGGSWVTTPAMLANQSGVVRNAALTLDTTGALAGTVTATFTGAEARWRRTRERHEEPPSRTKFIEADLRDDLGPGSHVTLTNEPDWDGAGTPWSPNSRSRFRTGRRPQATANSSTPGSWSGRAENHVQGIRQANLPDVFLVSLPRQGHDYRDAPGGMACRPVGAFQIAAQRRTFVCLIGYGERPDAHAVARLLP